MTESWTGHITADGVSDPIKDIHLWSTHGDEKGVVPSTSELQLIGNVRLSSIPLHLAAGPSLELCTDDEGAAEWLRDKLVPREELRLEQGELQSGHWKQLEIGVLLKTGGSRLPGEVTELLIYAELQEQEDASLALPSFTPPLTYEGISTESSMPRLFLLKIYALPLCSDIITKEPSTTKAKIKEMPRPASPSSKRKSLIGIFEDAAIQRRKFNGRGGERVLKALSNSDKVSSQQHGPKLTSNGEEVTADAPNFQKCLSRAPSVTDGNAVEASSGPQQAMEQTRRSFLHHVDKVLPPSKIGVQGKGADCAEINKAALAKVVLAGMRLHGLQPRRKQASQPRQESDVTQESSVAVNETLDDGVDEYKLIYHQTFKAATFSFRDQIPAALLAQEAMRDVVDRLLELFCPTTLAANLSCVSGGEFIQASGSVVQSANDAFDLPSSGTPFEPASRVWSTPKTKRRR